MLGLRFCARAFCSSGEGGPLFIAVRGPLTIAASPAAEHRLQTRRLSSHGSQAQPLWGMWDLPRPGLEPVSPASAGRFSTTAPPGKPQMNFIFKKREWTGQRRTRSTWWQGTLILVIGRTLYNDEGIDPRGEDIRNADTYAPNRGALQYIRYIRTAIKQNKTVKP